MNYDEFEWIKNKAECSIHVTDWEWEFLEDIELMYLHVEDYSLSPKQIAILERIRDKQ